MNISHSEMMFLSHVKDLSKENGYCYATNRHFKDFSGYGERQVERILKHLSSLKLLEVKKVDGLRRIYPVGCTDILSAIPTNKDNTPDILSVTPDILSVTPDILSTIENKERVKRENTSAQTLSTKSMPSMPSMYYNFTESIWYGINDEQVALWEDAYPAVDIELELRQMGEWCKSNGARGRKKNWKRFIVNWLKRAQDRPAAKKEWKR